MNNLLIKIDGLLCEAGIGQAFFWQSDKCSDVFKGHVYISSDINDDGELDSLISSASELLGDDMEIVCRYSASAGLGIEVFYAYVITEKSAEKICERFTEIVSNMGIDLEHLKTPVGEYSGNFFI